MSAWLTLSSGLLLLSGAFLCVSGAVGLLRFPDFYTRTHAAAVTDTLGSALIILGLTLHAGLDYLVLSKLLFILLFFFFTIPTSSHALAMAALYGGLKPLLGKQGSRTRDHQ
jgi:multicomponent Na+:H+ antiporter subunit G